METIQLSKLEEKKLKRREYMRNYKRNAYKNDAENMKNNNKMYYHLHNNNQEIKAIDICKYENIKGDVCKIICLINKMKNKNPELIKEFLYECLGKMENE